VPGEAVDAELPDHVPRDERAHRPAHEHRALESEAAEEVADVAGVLRDGVPALVRRRLTVAAQVDVDHAEALCEGGDVSLEEPPRHRHAVDQDDGPAGPGVVVGDARPVRKLVQVPPSRS
jgi:hypothetical protein